MVFDKDLFKGKVALVTGGTSGIGLATAEYLASLGATVVAAGLGSDKTQVRDGVTLDLRELDVTDHDGLAALINGLDRLDILVPAAGISLGEKEMEWASYRKVLDIQLDGVFKTIELSRPLLAKTKGQHHHHQFDVRLFRRRNLGGLFVGQGRDRPDDQIPGRRLCR